MIFTWKLSLAASSGKSFIVCHLGRLCFQKDDNRPWAPGFQLAGGVYSIKERGMSRDRIAAASGVN